MVYICTNVSSCFNAHNCAPCIVVDVQSVKAVYFVRMMSMSHITATAYALYRGIGFVLLNVQG